MSQIRRTFTAAALLIFLLVAASGALADSLSLQIPFYNQTQTHLATVEIQIVFQESATCTDVLQVTSKQIRGQTSPLGEVVAKTEISNLVNQGFGVQFQLSTLLFWQFDSSPGRKAIGTKDTTCFVSCDGRATCN